MAKFELIKTTDYKGQVSYLTRKNGVYVSGSLALNEEEAIQLFEIIKLRGNLDPMDEVVDSFNDDDLIGITNFSSIF